MNEKEERLIDAKVSMISSDEGKTWDIVKVFYTSNAHTGNFIDSRIIEGQTLIVKE